MRRKRTKTDPEPDLWSTATGPWVKGIDTRDVDDARAFLSSRFAPYSIQPLDDGRGFHLVGYELLRGSLGVMRVSYGSPVVVNVVQPVSKQYCIAQSMTGKVRLSLGQDTADLADGNSVVYEESRTITARREAGSELLVIRIDVTTVHSQLADIVGSVNPTGRFAMAGPTSKADRDRWRTVQMLLRQTLVDAPEPANGLWTSAVEQFTVAGMLATHPNSFFEVPPGPGTSVAAGARAALRAAEYLRDHHDQPVRVSELATQLHLTTRALQSAFQRMHGMTITAYVRQLRLQSAHHELKTKPEATIAGLAYKWGFSSPSRFAAYHRAHYGINPSEVAANR